MKLSWVVLLKKLPKKPEMGWGKRLGERLGETRAAIVRAMLANPKITMTELARSLKISTTAVGKHLRQLRGQDIIKRVGPARGGIGR